MSRPAPTRKRRRQNRPRASRAGASAGAARASAAAPTAASTPPAQEAYTYRADGRRDPFLNLIGQGSDAKLTSRKGEGPTGMSLGEISACAASCRAAARWSR